MNSQHEVSGTEMEREYAVTTEDQTAINGLDRDADEFIRVLRRSKRELDIARRQFDTVVDPMLIDHVVFRLGAAERHFNYLFEMARRLNISVDGMRWEWYEED